MRTENVAERYLLGRLDGPERETFEGHPVACGDCCGELADLCTLQGELEGSRERILAEAAALSKSSRRTWLLAAAAAVLTVAAGQMTTETSSSAPVSIDGIRRLSRDVESAKAERDARELMMQTERDSGANSPEVAEALAFLAQALWCGRNVMADEMLSITLFTNRAPLAGQLRAFLWRSILLLRSVGLSTNRLTEESRMDHSFH